MIPDTKKSRFEKSSWYGSTLSRYIVPLRAESVEISQDVGYNQRRDWKGGDLNGNRKKPVFGRRKNDG